MPLDIDDLIAHRPPFRFVDAVIEVQDETGVLALRLAPDDPRLRDGALHPLLLVEALAQGTAAFNAARGAQERDGPESGLLVAVERARLVGCARGGDDVRLWVRRGPQLGAMVRFFARAEVGGELLAEAELTVRRERGAAFA